MGFCPFSRGSGKFKVLKKAFKGSGSVSESMLLLFDPRDSAKSFVGGSGVGLSLVPPWSRLGFSS